MVLDILNDLQHLFFSNFKTPRTVPFFGMIIRRTADAFRVYPGVDGPGKISILHKPSGFAWIIVKPFTFPCRLCAAFIHLQDKAVRFFINDGLRVNTGIHAEIKRLFQALETGLLGKI